MENTSDSFMPRPLLFCLKSGRSVCYSVPDNTKARKGFTAALLQIKPEEIGETILLENEPPKEAEEAKRTVEEFRKLVESTEE